jgi:tungstate transport system substrate-binding protein
MYNDFVLIGPAADPAAVKGQDIVAALGSALIAPIHSTA